MNRLFKSHDARAIGLLFIVWLIFFWRILTPIQADQSSFKQGDFSGQFVAFGAYQYERMSQGEIPLWNLYNNAGLPFIGDTQAAVFYPPRLLTIFLSKILADSWSYQALQLEAIFHVLVYSFLMYFFIRRLTIGNPNSAYGAFVGAVVAAYGGFLSSYPPLQLAILEAAIWLPLGGVAILEATRKSDLDWRWIALAGFALGLSWMAGHPQTSWFLTYLLVAWLGYRVYFQRMGWFSFFVATTFMGIITLGTTAITFLPSVEYLRLTARPDLGFADKGNGFVFQDVAQFILPNALGLIRDLSEPIPSPLYVGIPALILAYIAIRDRVLNAFFWLIVAIIGLLHSFGANSAFYIAIYNFVPGLSFFRGQERAAFLVANSLAILAGMGATQITLGAVINKRQNILRALLGLIIILGVIAFVSFIGWQGNIGDRFYLLTGIAFFSLFVTAIFYGLLRWQLQNPNRIALILIATLIIFELVTVNMDSEFTYDNIPASEQLSISAPPIVQRVLDAAPIEPFRVDGFRGLEANYGSLYQVMDIRGISPLFLSNAQNIIYRDYNNNPLAWELFAVRYIYSERDSFNSIETSMIAEGNDSQGHIFLHEVANPRPFAHLVYQADVVDSDEFALALLDDPRYQPRESIILLGEPNIELPENPPDSYEVSVTEFKPETFTVEVNTPENAILSLAQVDYPGWKATLDNERVEILRAYGVLTAIAIPAGEHTIRLTYDPLTYRIGAILSLVTWGSMLILASIIGFHAINRSNQET